MGGCNLLPCLVPALANAFPDVLDTIPDVLDTIPDGLCCLFPPLTQVHLDASILPLESPKLLGKPAREQDEGGEGGYDVPVELSLVGFKICIQLLRRSLYLSN